METEKILGGIEILDEQQRDLLAKTQDENEKVICCLNEKNRKTWRYNTCVLVGLDQRLVYIHGPDREALVFHMYSVEYKDIYRISTEFFTEKWAKKDGVLKLIGDRLHLLIHHRTGEIGLYFSYEYEHQARIFAEWLRKTAKKAREKAK